MKSPPNRHCHSKANPAQVEADQGRFWAHIQPILESISDAIVLADLSGHELYHNPASLALHGYADLEEAMPTRDEGLPQWDIRDLGGRPVPEDERPLARVLRGDSLDGEEFCVRRCDTGKAYIGSYNGKILRNADGAAMFAMLTIRDITEQKQAEEALRESNQDLSEFGYALTHNVKAPFRAIQNYANFLLEDLAEHLEGEPRQFLEGIKNAARTATQQFQDLEALYRVKDHPVEFGILDIQELLSEIAALEGLPDRELIIDPQWPVLWGERFLLRQVLMGLIHNGFKYNRSDIKTVEVGWEKAADGRLEILVRDNGIGIDPRYHEHIFHIYTQARKSKSFRAVTIGLSI